VGAYWSYALLEFTCLRSIGRMKYPGMVYGAIGIRGLGLHTMASRTGCISLILTITVSKASEQEQIHKQRDLSDVCDHASLNHFSLLSFPPFHRFHWHTNALASLTNLTNSTEVDSLTQHHLYRPLTANLQRRTFFLAFSICLLTKRYWC